MARNYSQELAGVRAGEKQQKALYLISEAASSSITLEELYGVVHQIINELIPAKNFYIALYDQVTDIVHFPYYVDESDPNPGPIRKGKSLTEYVIKTEKPLLIRSNDHCELVLDNEYKPVGTPAKEWLGVPLRSSNNKVFGVMTVQTYEETRGYSTTDRDILTFVSTQVAMAIERKRSEQSLRESEQNYKVIVENTRDGIYIFTNRMVYANEQLYKILGISKEHVYDIDFFQFLHPDDRYRLLHALDYRDPAIPLPPAFEVRLTSQNKKEKILEMTPSFIQYMGVPGYLWVVRDITERKLMEQLQSALYRISETANLSKNLDTLYGSIHKIIGELIDAKNLYIALYHEPTNTVSFPYYVDQFSSNPGRRKGALGVTEYVIHTGQALLVNPEILAEMVQNGQVESFGALPVNWLGIPLRSSDDRIFGVLAVQTYTEGGMYTERDKKILHFVSNQVAMAIQRKRAEEERHRQTDLLSFLYDTSLDIMNRRNILNLLDTIVQKVTQIIDTPAAYAYLYNEECTERIMVAAAGEATPYIGTRKHINEGLSGLARTREQPVVLNDYQNWHHRTPPADQLATAVLCVPLKSSGKVIGTIGLWHSEPGRTFDTKDVEAVSQLVSLASIAYENAYLYREAKKEISERKQAEKHLHYLSFRDSLTGLYNRRYFQEELRRISRLSHPSVGIIIFDLDGLKLVNDAFGHEQGDVLIIETAKLLSQCFRKKDVVARIGGDEFAVILPYAGRGMVKTAYNRVLSKLAEWNEQNRQPPISMSIGYAVSEQGQLSMADLFKEADNNMYREKLQRSQKARSCLVQSMVQRLENKEYFRADYARQLQIIIEELGQLCGLTKDKISQLRLLGQFHNIGKIAISDSIFRKTEPLTPDEWKEIQRHCEIGHRIAQSSPELMTIADYVLKHHERWDGTGYPLGLKGENIPLESRILALADSYTAMSNDRPYRKALSHENILEELKKGSGTQFDPTLVAAFLQKLN